jgi:hypothetical protein
LARLFTFALWARGALPGSAVFALVTGSARATPEINAAAAVKAINVFIAALLLGRETK